MASIYDKASLVLIPSGTKTSKVYSQKPTNGDGDFTFSRSTAATRVNASGNIEKETQNLLLHSNSFDDAIWSHGSITLTGGQAGYDGSNNAWELNKAAAAYVALFQAISNSNVVTGTFYVKAGTLTTAALYSSTFTTPNAFAHFDLTNGNLLSSAGIVDASSEDVGNGWWRLSMVVSKGISNFRIYPDWSGSTAGTIYVQDAQLEQGLVARDYIETTTTAIYGGITDNVPRLDYQGSCPALLLEPQRTNLVPHSEYFGDWGTFRSSITANDATSPENYTNSYKLIQQSGETTSGGIFKGISVATSTAYTYSFFAKAAGYNWCYARVIHSSDNFYAWFDLDNGVVGNTTGSGVTSSIEDYGSGWYKCSITYTSTTTLSNLHIYIADSNGSGTLSNPDGVKGIHIYGAQLEQGSYATSYIPTYGSAVTRNQDAPNMQLDNLKTKNILSDKFTIMFEFKDWDRGASAGQISYIYNTGGQAAFYVYGGSIGVHTPSGDQYATFPEADGKFAIVYDGTNVQLYKNGAKYGSSYTASARWADAVAYRVYVSGATAKIKYNQMLMFPTALTDQEAIDLTTI